MEEKAQRIVKEIKIKQSSMAFHFLVSVVIRSDHDGGMRVFRHINSLDVVHSIWLNSSQRSETVDKNLGCFLEARKGQIIYRHSFVPKHSCVGTGFSSMREHLSPHSLRHRKLYNDTLKYPVPECHNTSKKANRYKKNRASQHTSSLLH